MNADQISSLTSIYFSLGKRANPHETLYFTLPEFRMLMDCGLIVSFEKGGLLLAPSHAEGGVNVLGYEDGVYRFTAEYEGWEYILSPKATKQHFDRIKQINEVKSDRNINFAPYAIPNDILIIDALPVDFLGTKLKKYLVHPGDGVYIVNKQSTKIHLGELNHLNMITS